MAVEQLLDVAAGILALAPLIRSQRCGGVRQVGVDVRWRSAGQQANQIGPGESVVAQQRIDHATRHFGFVVVGAKQAEEFDETVAIAITKPFSYLRRHGSIRHTVTDYMDQWVR